MSAEWKKLTLGDIAEPSGGMVDGPFGSNLKAASYTKSGIPVIRGSNLTLGLGGFKSDEFVYVEYATLERLKRSECLAGDIIFTKKGTLGQTGLVPFKSEYQSYLLSSNQMRLRVDKRFALPEFIYYLVSSPESVSKIKQDSEYTGVPKINLDYLRKFPICIPDVNTQVSVVKIISVLNKKIQLNRQINQTLESMAQAIFQSWFVDFDPVKAKIAAREQWQTCTDDQRTEWLNELLETQVYFKTCLLELTAKAGISDAENVQLKSSLDLISCRGHGPEGSENLDIGLNNLRKEWQSKIAGPALQSASETLYINIAAMTAISSRDETSLAGMSADEIAQLYKTASLFPERLVESELGEIPEGWRLDELRKIAHFSTERIDLSELTLENYVSTENMLEHKKGITTASSLPTVKTVPKFEPGQILISNIRPYFMKIWLASFVGGRSNDVLGINSKEPESIQYLYNLLYQDRFFNFMMTTSKGAKMPRGDKEAIMSWLCVQPTFEIKNAYSEIVEKFVEIVVNNKKENKYLENARDTLLPKLLSGELDISSLTKLSDIEPAAMDV